MAPASGRVRGWAPVATTAPSNTQPVAVVELEGVARHVEGRGHVPEPQIEAEGVDLLGIAQSDPVEAPGAGQKLLRQRRAVVGLVRLGADQDDPTVVALGAQRLGRPQPGQRCADNGDRRVRIEHHERPKTNGPRRSGGAVDETTRPSGARPADAGRAPPSAVTPMG